MWYENQIDVIRAARMKKRAERLAFLHKQVEVMVAEIINFCEGYNLDEADLVSVGVMSLVKGMNSRNRSINHILSNVCNSIASSVVAEIEYQDAMATLDTMDEVVGCGFEDVVADIADELNPWILSRLRRAVGRLSDRHRLVLEHRYELSGKPFMTYRQLAVKLDRSIGRVQQLELEAVKTLREMLHFYI